MPTLQYSRRFFVRTFSRQCRLYVHAGGARLGALASTSIALLGLMRLNLQGPGITETVKQLWRRPVATQ